MKECKECREIIQDGDEYEQLENGELVHITCR